MCRVRSVAYSIGSESDILFGDLIMHALNATF